MKWKVSNMCSNSVSEGAILDFSVVVNGEFG